MIGTRNLTKKFDDLTAVNSINLRVKTGEVLALLGPNGAGKTTTIRMLTSLLKPTAGTAEVNGFDVSGNPDMVRRSVGVLTEQHGLYNRMKGLEYLGFFGSVYGLENSTRRQRCLELLKQFGLEKAAEKKVGEYSKGMRQKLALARALLHQPPVLLLDEPTSAMDPESARLVRNAIKNLKNEDRTIIVCTHNLFEAEELADKVAIIHLGKIILQGNIEALKKEFHQGVQFRLRFHSPNGNQPDLNSLPPGVVNLTAFEDGLTYFTSNPQEDNPVLVEQLVKNEIKIFSLEEVPTSLEKLYLDAVGQENDKKPSK